MPAKTKPDECPIPSCSLIPSITIAIGGVAKIFDLSANITNKPSFENGKLYFTHSISTSLKEYATGKTFKVSKTKKNLANDIFGFSFDIPGINVKLPSFTIPKWPMINYGCHECIDDEWPPLCEWEKKEVKVCTKIKIGPIRKKVCFQVPYWQASKCVDEIGFAPKTLPSVEFFELKKTHVEFKFQIIPDIEVDVFQSCGLSAGASFTMGEKNEAEVDAGTPILNFTLNTCKLGLKISIEKLSLTYGGKGVNITKIKIPIIPAYDLFPGNSCLTGEADAEGNLKLWYLLKSTSITLYDIFQVAMNAVDSVGGAIKGVEGDVENTTGNIPGTGSLLDHILSFKPPQIIINFLKQTQINIAIGLLICPLPRPDETMFLGLVTTAWTTLAPFKDLNKITIPEIPEKYTQIPSIPNSPYLSDDLTDAINEQVEKFTNIPLELAAKEIVYIADYIKNTIENIEISVVASIPLPLILKKPPA